MEEKINQILSNFKTQISEAQKLENLDKLFLELFGKNGLITVLPKEFSNLSKDQLKIIGPLFNQVKTELENLIEQKREDVREESYKILDTETIDIDENIDIPQRIGYLHPISEFENKIAEIFAEMGFQQFNAPHIDTDWYNFESLNLGPEHPARDLWDTLYIDGHKYGFEEGKLLLKTHTTNSELHIMEKFKPPFRFMTIDRCFRYENLDARHEHTFDQFEIFYVDKNLSMANLQYLSEVFLKKMLGDDIKVRLKPGYYPFTEPSAHIQGQCIFCKGTTKLPDNSDCRICENGWIALGGAGMTHPNVLKNGGIDPEIYSGIAWGCGPGRMAMLKYDVSDVRLFNSADLEFLQGLRSKI